MKFLIDLKDELLDVLHSVGFFGLCFFILFSIPALLIQLFILPFELFNDWSKSWFEVDE